MSLPIDCRRCGKTFVDKYGIKQHLERGKGCKPLSPAHDIESAILIAELFPTSTVICCKWCDRVFKQESYKNRHQQTCLYNEDNYNASKSNASTSGNASASVSKPLDDFQTFIIKKLDEVTDMLKMQKPSTNTNTNNTTNITININSLGKESLDHITSDILSNYVKNVQFIDMVKDVNFNKNKPENHNVKRMISSKNYYKNMFLKYYDDGRWTMDTFDERSCSEEDKKQHYEDHDDSLSKNGTRRRIDKR